jgi:hypothetical protein
LCFESINGELRTNGAFTGAVPAWRCLSRQTCLMVGRDVARLPDLANRGSVSRPCLTDDQNEMIVERPYGLQTGPVRGYPPNRSKVCQSLLNRLVRSGLQGLRVERARLMGVGGAGFVNCVVFCGRRCGGVRGQGHIAILVAGREKRIALSRECPLMR